MKDVRGGSNEIEADDKRAPKVEAKRQSSYQQRAQLLVRKIRSQQRSRPMRLLPPMAHREPSQCHTVSYDYQATLYTYPEDQMGAAEAVSEP